MRRLLVLACGVLGLALPASAGAAITTTRDARLLTGAMAAPGAQGAFGAASFRRSRPTAIPTRSSTRTLGGFPTEGETFAILSTGDAALADNANTGTGHGADDGGPQGHGDPADPEIAPGNAYDTSILRVDFTTPPGTNCLAFGFRFLSEEFPENVGNVVNDGFIAQLDTSAGSADEERIDLGTRQLRLRRPGRRHQRQHVRRGRPPTGGRGHDLRRRDTAAERGAADLTPGAHSLYLSIFDQGDQNFDSAVFVDRLDVPRDRAPVAACAAPRREVDPAPALGARGRPEHRRPDLQRSAGDAPGDASTVTVKSSRAAPRPARRCRR